MVCHLSNMSTTAYMLYLNYLPTHSVLCGSHLCPPKKNVQHNHMTVSLNYKAHSKSESQRSPVYSSSCQILLPWQISQTIFLFELSPVIISFNLNATCPMLPSTVLSRPDHFSHVRLMLYFATFLFLSSELHKTFIIASYTVLENLYIFSEIFQWPLLQGKGREDLGKGLKAYVRMDEQFYKLKNK